MAKVGSRASSGDYVFPETKSWPIGDKAHAKLALVYATWPQNVKVREKVVAAVLAKYPELKDVGAAKAPGSK